jgi:hypothetical protein
MRRQDEPAEIQDGSTQGEEKLLEEGITQLQK